MKKILIADDLKKLLLKRNDYLNIAGIRVYTAATNDELLSLHREEKANLIITHLDMSGIKNVDLFRIIRNDKDLRDVSLIMICKGNLVNRELCKQCGANAIITIPVDPDLLHGNVRKLLNVAPRSIYRAALAVAIEGKFKDRPLPFWTENISVSGMLIKTEEPLSRDDGIFFSFYLPNGAHVSGYGEIIRVIQVEDEPGVFLYGVRFTSIDPDVKYAIKAAMK
ncbi:MAG: response regulator [Nitrospirae bacterium]|nr:response regulator [Nitrospirota bacterium]